MFFKLPFTVSFSVLYIYIYICTNCNTKWAVYAIMCDGCGMLVKQTI